MPKPYDFGSVGLDVGLGTEESPARLATEPDTPFRILVLGDFSGRANRGVAEKLDGRRPILVDRDNFDGTLKKLGAALDLGPQVRLRFNELDDFLPDRIYQSLEIFGALRETRRQLEDPATFRAAAARLRPEPEATPPPRPAPASAAVSDLLSGSLLDQMIEQAGQGAALERPARSADPLAAYVRELVAPHLTPKPDAKQPEMLAQVDRAIGGAMRAILHHADFQALEAAWRALFFLLRELETGAELKLSLLDISRAELEADLVSARDLRASGLYRILVEQTVGTPGAHPWAVVAGDFVFDDSVRDAELLGRLALIASQAGAPILAAAHPRLLGCDSLADAPHPRQWRADGAEAFEIVRELPEAAYVGLAVPRLLLRLPFGPKTEPTELFEFDEMPGGSRHDDYLWGNSAFACLLLMGQAFAEYGWEMRPGIFQELRGLPSHIYTEDGEAKQKACAEAYLTLEAAEQILERGLIPVVSFQDRNAVRVVRFQSIARPAAPLAGRWSG